MHLGQEIYLFFYRFGINGIWGIVICNIIMASVIYKTLNIAYEKNISTYKRFLDEIFLENSKLSNFTNIIINIFLCATFFIMVSGFGTYLSQSFGLNQMLGSSVLALIAYILFLNKIESFAKINNIVIPILISIILIIGIINILNLKEINNNIYIDKSYFWIFQAILYASYNLVLVEPVLINLKQFLKNKKQILKISISVGIIMTILAILEFLLLANVDISFKNLEMPLVYLIGRHFPKFTYLYGITILIAIFTTAVSVGISFLNNINKNEKSFPQKAFILCISSVIISQISFSKLVENLFPLFGFLGLIQMSFILKKK